VCTDVGMSVSEDMHHMCFHIHISSPLQIYIDKSVEGKTIQLVGLKLCWLYTIAHNAQPSILAGVGTTVIDVGLAVGPGVAWCTSAREGVNTIL